MTLTHKKYGISLRQQKFVDNYIRTGVITQSAIEAGYVERYAYNTAYTFLDNPKIVKYMLDQMAHHNKKGVADQEEILMFLTGVIRGKEAGKSLIGVGGGEQAITDIEPTLLEKLKASELLGKRYAMWTDKQLIQELQPIIIDDVPEDD